MANGNEKIWVSDIIGEEYKEWSNKIVLLACGTGKGKTTFALGTYCEYLSNKKKSVIYLCNRTSLKDQVRHDIEEYNIDVTCISYQQFTGIIMSGDSVPVFDVYICDEAHYFLSDSGFNLYTDVIYRYLMGRANKATLVFMTATYKNIFERIKMDARRVLPKLNVKTYYLPTDYSYVDKIFWFRNGDLYGIIDDLLKNTQDKIMYFCNSITKMRKLYNHYSPTRGHDCDQDENIIHETKIRYMNFYCSDNPQNNGIKFIKNHSSKDVVTMNQDAGGYTFGNRMLITTKVLDNGVDFKDRKIKHIICDIFDLESAIQCLGRKRIFDDSDSCIFYIRDYQSYELNLFYKNIVEQLEPVELLNNDREQWIKRYGKDRKYIDYTIFYDFDYTHDWQINMLRFEKLLSDKDMIHNMMNNQTSYRAEILEYLGESVSGKSVDMSDVVQERVQDIIEIYLKNNVDKQLFKDKQKKFAELCNIKDRFNRLQTSIGQIKNYLEVNYSYTIISKQIKTNGKRVRYWMIKKSPDIDCRPP